MQTLWERVLNLIGNISYWKWKNTKPILSKIFYFSLQKIWNCIFISKFVDLSSYCATHKNIFKREYVVICSLRLAQHGFPIVSITSYSPFYAWNFWTNTRQKLMSDDHFFHVKDDAMDSKWVFDILLPFSVSNFHSFCFSIQFVWC